MSAAPDPEEQAWAVVRTTQRALLHQPVATQAALSALVAEGRRYAETPEGAALREQLSRSSLVHRARVLWEIATMSAFEEETPRLLPTAILEALARASSDRSLEARASELMEQLDV